MTEQHLAETEGRALQPATARGAAFDMVPRSFEELLEYSRSLARSDLVPKDYRAKPENIMVAIQMGVDVGLRPMQALQNIAVINGRPCLWGDAVLAIVRASPVFDWCEESWSADGQVAVCRVKRRGEEPVERQFSVADAKRAGLWSKPGPWQQYPQRMLQMRARSWAIRDAFPDVLKGLNVREEVMDSVIDGELAREPAPEPGRKARDVLSRMPEASVEAPTEPKAESAAERSPSDIDAVLAYVAEATLDDAETVIQRVNALEKAREKKAAMTAWRERRAALEAVPSEGTEQPAAESGTEDAPELELDGGEPPISVDDVVAALDAATDLDAVAELEDLARGRAAKERRAITDAAAQARERIGA